MQRCLATQLGRLAHAARRWQQQQQQQQHAAAHAAAMLLLGPSSASSAWPSQQQRRSCASTPASGGGSAATAGARGGGSPAAAGKDMVLVFTCGRCGTRAAKAFSRQAYDAGVVLITCPGCQAMHLIADHLGWFGEGGFKVDEHLAAQGERVKRVTLDGTGRADGGEQQLTAEDLAGWSRVQQLLTRVATAAGSSATEHEAPGSGCCGSGGGPDSSAAGSGDEGVVAVSPADVEAWTRVQQENGQG